MLADKKLEKQIIDKVGQKSYNFVMRELQDISDKYSYNLETSFEIFSNALLTGRNYELCIQDCLIEKDGGIDSFYIDKENSKIWLIQSKFKKVHSNFVDSMITSFKDHIEGEIKPNGDSKSLLKIKEKYNYDLEPVYYTVSLQGGHDDTDEYERKNIFKMLSNAGDNFSSVNIKLELKLISGNSINKEESETGKKEGAEYIVTDLNSYRDTLRKLNEYYYEYLFDMNLRGDVRKNDRIVSIEDTIENHPSMFELYNNGVTIITDKISKNKKFLTLTNPKIINGQQTTRTIKNYQNFIESDARVMIKVIQSEDPNVINKIAQYSNSQSKINDSDLLSCHESIKKLKNTALSNKINIITKSGKSKFLEYEKVSSDMSIKLSEFIKAFYIIKDKKLMGILKSKISVNTNSFITDCKSIKWNRLKLLEILDIHKKYTDFENKIKAMELDSRPIELNNVKRAQLLIMRSFHDGYGEEKTIKGIKKIIEKYRSKHGDEMNIFKSSSVHEYYDEIIV